MPSGARIVGTRTAAVALTVTVVLWASAFVGIRSGLRGFTPLHLAVLRYLVASAALLAIAAVRGLRWPARADLPRFALLGLIGIAAYNVAINFGELTLGAGAASFVVNSAPLFTALIAAATLGERLSGIAWAGMLVSFAGVGLIGADEGSLAGWNAGALAVLAAAVLQSVFFVLQKPLLARYTPLEVACHAIWSGTLWLLPALFGVGAALRGAAPAALFAVAYLGIFPAALGYLCWSVVLHGMPASRASSFLFLVPLVSVGLAFVVLGERPAAPSLVGGALVLAGVTLVQRARRRP